MYNMSDKIICKDCESKQTGAQVATKIKNGKEISLCKNCHSENLKEIPDDIEE